MRWLCFAAMTLAAVWNERTPGVPLRDPLLERVPYVPLVEAWNYRLWLAAWLPFVFVVLALDARRFVRLMVSCGLLSLLRGATILATHFGPVRGPDVNAALDWTPDLYWRTVAAILDPLQVFGANGAQVWLTKDLFFSGHTATTFLLLLYVWRWPRLRAIVLVMHVLVVASLFLGRIHYGVDVLGGWCAAGLVFRLRERRHLSP